MVTMQFSDVLRHVERETQGPYTLGGTSGSLYVSFFDMRYFSFVYFKLFNEENTFLKCKSL